MTKIIDIFQYASDIAANQRGSAEGPTKLIASSQLARLNLNLKYHDPIKPQKLVHKLDAQDEISRMCEALADKSYQAAHNHHRFLTLGGDHSAAIGTWSGASAALASQGEIGLIWFDAHMDAHTPQSSHSKNIHGMPLAALLGYGPAKLTQIKTASTKLKATNLALIGIRSYEKEEQELLHELNAKIYYIDEVQQRGLDIIIQEAISLVSKNTIGFGVSLDIDAVDPKSAPAVSTPVKNGIIADELLPALELIKRQSNFFGAEIVEFNPQYDTEDKTLQLIIEIIETLFSA